LCIQPTLTLDSLVILYGVFKSNIVTQKEFMNYLKISNKGILDVEALT